MIYIRLFLVFLKIGAVSFGGGYGMISLLEEEALSHNWLSQAEFIDFIAVSESTPGPLAVNMATFIGSAQAGLPGALLATLGVVLPSFIIILITAAVFTKLIRYKAVNAVLSGIRPCVAGLIVATAIVMILSLSSGIDIVGDAFSPDTGFYIIFAAAAGISFIYSRLKKKSISPILIIICSAGLGMIFYGA